MRIVNLTPHVINIASASGETVMSIASSGVARVSEMPSVSAEPVDGVPTIEPVKYGPVVCLPDEDGETYYIVSLLTVMAVRSTDRTTSDLLTPASLVRDASGNIVGCTSLARHG